MFIHKLAGILKSQKQHPLEVQLGHRFKNKELLDRALRHRSFAYAAEGECLESNERLEFLGDAVLDLVVTEFLFQRYPTKTEGDLSEIKSLMVSKRILRKAAEKLGLGNHVYLSPAEEKTGGRRRTSILADTYEALLGALFLDKGLSLARRTITESVLVDIDTYLKDKSYTNYKSQLLELTQGSHLGVPNYVVTAENGPDHNKTFEISVTVSNETWGTGTGKSKKLAEQEAARNALQRKKGLLTTHSKESTV